MAIPSKGLNNIRTLSGRVDQVSLPYRIYMQITCLEMEKARRNVERKNSSQRIREIDARLEEIEKQKEALLQALAHPHQKPAAGLPGVEVKVSPRRSTSALRIRY